MNQPRNLGLCSRCWAQVPAEFFTRDGQTWIRKDCPDCGPNEALVSSDAACWQAKRDLVQYIPTDRPPCSLQCDKCQAHGRPNMVFVDVTNRCNMNCPICIATIRDMGFDFNPPMAYFEKLFGEVARIDPKPVVQLFGGEPTVRNDLLEIIATAKKHGLKPHVVTNGIRLADEEYCKQLCEARVPMRFSFDGHSPEIYEQLRHNRAAYDQKLKALANLKKHSRRKHTIMVCAAWGFNDQYMPELIQFCHDNRDLISDVGIIPLTENWKPGEFAVEVRTTAEDAQKIVAQGVPGGNVEFVPAGLSYALKKPRSFFRKNPRSEVLLLAGVHPNCESMTLLISDGKTYRSVNQYLRTSLSQAAKEVAAISRKVDPKLDKLDRDKFFQRVRGQLLLIRAFGPWVLRTVRLGRLIGNPLTFLARAIAGRFRKAPGDAATPRRPRRVMRVGILPFEEQHSIDARRLEHCKAVFAYEDTDDGRIKYFPACSWYPYRNPRLEKISAKYGIADGKGGVKAVEDAEAARRKTANRPAPTVPAGARA